MRRLCSKNYRLIGISLAVLVLTLFGLAAPAAASDQVPFTSSGTTVITGITRLPGGITQVDFSHSGTATYLGDYTGTGTSLVDQQGNATNTSCLVGANGTDSVCIATSGHRERTKGSCVFTTTGPYTVTGGTGKFANATGGGIATAQVDECTGTGSGMTTGTISRPHSG